jgi:UDP-N-acetylglucosamine acyltransferase
MAYAHIGHDCTVGNSLYSGKYRAGGWACNHRGLGHFWWRHVQCSNSVKVGAHAYDWSGGSLVRKDVPPYTKAAREPLAYAGVNTVGLKRRGFTTEIINDIQEAYRYIFLKGINNTKALELIKQELPASPELDYIVDFVRTSERGVMKGFATNTSLDED